MVPHPGEGLNSLLSEERERVASAKREPGEGPHTHTLTLPSLTRWAPPSPGSGEGGEREASRVRASGWSSRAAADPGGREAQADSGADAECAVERDRAAMQLDE